MEQIEIRPLHYPGWYTPDGTYGIRYGDGEPPSVVPKADL